MDNGLPKLLDPLKADVRLSTVFSPGERMASALVRVGSQPGIYAIVIRTKRLSLELHVSRAWLDQFRLEVARELAIPFIESSN